MTHNQHSKVHALALEAFAFDGVPAAEADELRRSAVLDLAALVGQPGLTSRSEISRATVGPLIEALEAIKAGTLALDAGVLVDAASGEVVARGAS
jgi:hypothetical protein